MPTDIDAALRRLPAGDHPGLAAIEVSVMARIHERSDASFGAPMMAIAAIGAIALGVTAGTFPAAPAAAASLSPFGPANPLAPSTLLASDR